MSAPVSVPLPHLDGVRHRDVYAAGIRFHVAELGPEDGDPILLLHGWPQHWYMWRHVAPRLPAGRRLVMPDLRGFGWTDAPPGPQDMAGLSQDVLLVLDALGLDSVDLIAHDWGAWIGFLLCLDHPERVRHYVALNILPPWPDPPSARGLLGAWRLWYQVVLATPGLAPLLLERTDVVPRLIRTGAAHPEAWTPADLASFRDVLAQPAHSRASSRLYRTFLTRDVKPYLAGARRGQRLTVPTVLLFGTRDAAINHRRLGTWADEADDMAVEKFDDAGHFIGEELPAVVAARATALFAGGRPADVVAEAAR